MKNLIKILILISVNAVAEPTDLQRQLISERASMMDIFLEKSERDLSASLDGNSIHVNHDSTYHVETINKEKEIIITPKVSVSLDWDRGKWLISYSVYDLYGQIISLIKPTISNARNLCLNLLDELEFTSLDPTNAAHRGFSRPTYTAADLEKIEEYSRDTIHVASIILMTRNPQKKYLVKCERPLIRDNDKDQLKFKIEGSWE